jgi:hypothetical protein
MENQCILRFLFNTSLQLDIKRKHHAWDRCNTRASEWQEHDLNLENHKTMIQNIASYILPIRSRLPEMALRQRAR